VSISVVILGECFLRISEWSSHKERKLMQATRKEGVRGGSRNCEICSKTFIVAKEEDEAKVNIQQS
jgi:hypothetical protein